MKLIGAMSLCYLYDIRWLGGSAVRALDARPKGPRFNSQPVIATLSKLFTLYSVHV